MWLKDLTLAKFTKTYVHVLLGSRKAMEVASAREVPRSF